MFGQSGVSDEELIHQLSLAVKSEEDRQKRLVQAASTRQQKVYQVQSQELNKQSSPIFTPAMPKQDASTNNLLAAIQSLQENMASLKSEMEHHNC